MSTRLVNGGRIKNGVFETYDKGTKSYVSTDQKVNAKDFGKTEVGKATQYSGDNPLVAAYSNNYKPANAKKQKVTSSNSVLDTRQTTDAVNNAGNALVVDGGGNNNFQQSGLMDSMYNSQNVQNEAYQDQFQALELMFDAGLARQNQKYGQLQQELQDNLQKATQIADVNAAALNPYSQAQGAATADNFKGKIVQDYQKQAQNLQAQAEAAEQELRAGNYEAYVNISNAMKTSNAQFQQGIQEFLVNQQAMVQDQANKDRSFGLQEDEFNYGKSQDAIDNFQTFVNDFGMDKKLRGEIGNYFESGVVSEGLRPLIEKGVEAGYSMDEALSIAQYDTLEQTKEKNDQAYRETQTEISWYNAATSRINANKSGSGGGGGGGNLSEGGWVNTDPIVKQALQQALSGKGMTDSQRGYVIELFDAQGLPGALNWAAQNKLGAAAQEDYNTFATASDFLANVYSQLENAQYGAGPYTNLAEKAKPWAGMDRDPQLASLKQQIEIAQAQTRKAYYGTAVTDSESVNANKFLINDTDDFNTMKVKIKGLSDAFRYVNDKNAANTLGIGDQIKAENYMTPIAQAGGGQEVDPALQDMRSQYGYGQGG